jgi:mannose-1-phosphate guanylyltransferase
VFYAVIMAGGSGTRLWPLSRRSHPKQALKLIGERTMFQHAVDRLAPLFTPAQIYVITSSEHADILKAQTPEIPSENFLLEPEGRGTAPAIGLAAVHLRHKDIYAVMAVLTADHYITDTASFRQALSAAKQVAESGYLVTLGIQPTSPSTGFGYIHLGSKIEDAEKLPVYQVEKFVEKPDAETAAKMLLSGDYSWNSGMFIWRVNHILEEFERQMPTFYAQLEDLETFLGTPNYTQALNRIWPKVIKQTIDYGIMEHAERVAAIPVRIGWSDIGSWASLFELLPTDSNGNSWTGPHIEIDTSDTLVFGAKRLIAAIGLQGLVIVDTDDALLVCTKEREQEVREVVRLLKENGRSQWL